MTVKIVLVAPYAQLARDAEEVCRTYGERVEIVVGQMEQGVRLGKKAVDEGAVVLISRGGTSLELGLQAAVPTVEIAVTPYDVLRALQKANGRGTRFGVAGFINVIGGMDDWREMLTAPVVPIVVESYAEITRQLTEAIRHHGVDCLLGDAGVVQQAAALGVPGVLIESGKESIWAAIQEAKRIVAARMAERQAQATLHTALDKVTQGLVVIERGTVVFANRTVLQWIGRDTFTGVSAGDCLPPALFEFVQDPDPARRSDVLGIGGKLWFAERDGLASDARCFVTLQPVDEIESIERQVRQKRTNGGHAAHYTFDDLYGKSRAMRLVVARAIHFSQSESSVLIVGETGTGKEVLAQSIHNASSRAHGPFVAVNCAALPDQLLESELFGYDEGAFTGARRGGKPGLFELAHGGTIFLDEIGETPLHVQQRLLRVLQERQVMRIGGEKVIPINVRVIAATNQPLWQFVQQGKFRKDLFFRLDVLRLNTVPLRERQEDIPELTERMLRQIWFHRKGVGVQTRIDPSVYPILQEYYWPGNVRELQNMVDYLFATVEQGHIDAAAIAEWMEQKALPQAAESVSTGSHSLQRSDVNTVVIAPERPPIGTMDELERWAVQQTLAVTDGDLTRAAQRLGISRTTLWRKLKQWQQDEQEDGTEFA